jgi:hypothetical protein
MPPYLLQRSDHRADPPRRTEAALKAIVLDEGGLHWVRFVRRAQALDGRDLVTLVHDGEAKA